MQSSVYHGELTYHAGHPAIENMNKSSAIKIGSDAHRELFCRHFIDTYTDYEPRILPWPELSAAEADLERLQRVPFWQERYWHTERRAGDDRSGVCGND